MPNTGMLDHRVFQPSTRRATSAVHWFGAWPSQGGYKTVRSLRVTNFSRHLIKEMQPQLTLQRQLRSRPGTATSLGNSVSPFNTIVKPTCGYFFSRETDNRKRNIGIPPSNVVAWRSSHRTQSAPARRT
ncbi:uncharacterized protein LOC135343505 [Halichondria panicea]|uniref:uncharacterized protein LOC135343505 n=1 Tax=Halichondria panicea TaxID=6063 RepID=UPI00312B7CCF